MWLIIVFGISLCATGRFRAYRPLLLWTAVAAQAGNGLLYSASLLSLQQTRHLTGCACILYVLGLALVMNRTHHAMHRESGRKRAVSRRYFEGLEWLLADGLRGVRSGEASQAMAALPDDLRASVQARREVLEHQDGSEEIHRQASAASDEYRALLSKPDRTGSDFITAASLALAVPLVVLGMGLVHRP